MVATVTFQPTYSQVMKANNWLMALSQILGALFLRDSKKAVAFLESFFIAPGVYAELKRPKMTF